MAGTDADQLVTLLGGVGFEILASRHDQVRLARAQPHPARVDHVRIDLVRLVWLARMLGQPRNVAGVAVGIIYPIAEQAFARPVPPQPLLPDQVHVATSAAELVSDGEQQTLATAIDAWLKSLPRPVDALEAGLVNDPLRRLEFAVLATDRRVGEEAARAARAHLEDVAPSRRRQVLRRIELAEQRLRADHPG